MHGEIYFPPIPPGTEGHINPFLSIAQPALHPGTPHIGNWSPPEKYSYFPWEFSDTGSRREGKEGRKEGEGVTCSLTELSMSPPQTLPLAMWNLTGSPKTDSPKTCHHASSHPMEEIDAVVPNLF